MAQARMASGAAGELGPGGSAAQQPCVATASGLAAASDVQAAYAAAGGLRRPAPGCVRVQSAGGGARCGSERQAMYAL